MGRKGGRASEALERIFPGDSEMARRMRAFDWSTTGLGHPTTWPENLRTAVSICLTSRFPIVLWWGADLTVLYNDGYISMLGPGKHPQALGMPGCECWSDIWDTIGPMLHSVMESGQATWSEELPLFLNRHLPREECYFTFSYSPILTGDASKVGGIFCAVTETTDYVLGRRRLGTLRDLGERLANLATPEAALQRAAEVLADNAHDVPMAALYRVDHAGDEARLVASVRLEAGSEQFPSRIAFEDDSVWPLGPVWRSRTPAQVALPAAVGSAGAWAEPPEQALVLPIGVPGFESVGAVLVAGVSPRRLLDDDYREFFSSFAARTGTAMAEALAYEVERTRAEGLAELDRAKTAFFSNVSHEFRTPLTLMLGPLEDALAQHDEALGPRTAERLDVAHRNSLRLLKLVNTLLDFSRIEAGRIEASYEETDLAALTEELASVFRSAIERAGLTLEVSCRKIGAPVFVDREMWEKVLMNLLSNAFKFTLQGGIAVQVRDAGTHALVEVRDTGTGIPADELPRVFERFHRGSSGQGRTHEGTGIGLALVQELVKLHGGTVGVESELGVGSTFSVRIPVGSAHLPADRLNAGRTLASSALGATPYLEEALRWLPDAESTVEVVADRAAVRVSTAGARVLVADDNQDVRDYLRRLLSPHWHVDTVADGEAALERIASKRPDLVLSDVMMPRRDGFGLLRALREDEATRTLPVILLSARAGEEARVEGLAAGADDYLIKPFSARELLARVNTHLELARVRSEAMRAVTESEERFRVLADGAPALIWVAGRDGCEYVNRRYCEFFGAEVGELLGFGWTRFVHAEDRDHYLEAYTRAFEARVPYEADCRLRRRDGVYRATRSIAMPRLGPYGEFLGYTVLTLDVHERMVAEAEREALLESVERARRDAERANQAKDQFLAVLSHELRSPLNAMLGWVRVLKGAESQDAELVDKAVDTLERNIRVQTQIIDDLLDVSRIQSGKLRLAAEPLDFGALVRECAESQRPSAEGKQIAVHLDVEDAEMHVVGDASRLHQVVGNLFGNAVKFTPSGGAIQVAVERTDGKVCLRVADTGQGIAPEFMPLLFERFRQADGSAARKHGGLGLGLSIVRTLVELHGGEVRAESAGVGRGSVFVVTLPLASSAALAARAAVRTPGARAAASPALDILLVEDDADTRLALELTLRRSGRVRAAASVPEALEAYTAQRPDVLISDIGMPGEDGYVLIRAIRDLEEGRAQRTLAVAMTGFAGHQDHELALRAGFDDHVAKPVDPFVLMDRIRGLVASRGGRRG